MPPVPPRPWQVDNHHDRICPGVDGVETMDRDPVSGRAWQPLDKARAGGLEGWRLGAMMMLERHAGVSVIHAKKIQPPSRVLSIRVGPW